LISGANAGLDGMMEGLDGSFNAAMLIGYHALSGALHGMMDHALVGGLHRFWINGKEAGEIAASAAVAGAHGVPLVCVTSDDVACAEASSTIPGVSVYSTKRGFGRYAGEMLHPSETGPGIEAAAGLGVANRGAIQTYRVVEPVTLRFAFRTTNEADEASQLPDTERLDGYTLEFTRPDFITAHRDAYTLFALSIRGRKSEA
jgi:D-amino peptidase